MIPHGDRQAPVLQEACPVEWHVLIPVLCKLSFPHFGELQYDP